MKAINNTTQVRVAEQSLVEYEYRTWFIFGWYVKVSTKKIKNDLVINTTEEFDQVIINNQQYILPPDSRPLS